MEATEYFASLYSAADEEGDEDEEWSDLETGLFLSLVFVAGGLAASGGIFVLRRLSSERGEKLMSSSSPVVGGGLPQTKSSI